MAAVQGTADAPARAESQRVRRQSRVVGGLVLTFLGLLLALGVLPIGPAALQSTLPIFGAALLAVWIGGILLGNARRPRRPAPN